MRAPVYRNIEASSTVLGLAFPTEAVLLMSSAAAAVLTLPPILSAPATLVAYVAIRFVNRGRAPAFVQHYFAWRLRRAKSSGVLSAAARVRCPRFPFVRYEYRDVGRRETS
ncbi:MAG TPA: hypothetical protein VFV14_01565 [Myxococcaceae bacterium]|nr:hypothetical protein [Myxococcaceae bacterium]